MQEKLDNLLIYILENLDQVLTLDSLSKASGISPFYLHRLFKKHFGQPIKQFVQQCRLEKAAVSLATRPFKSVIDIAFDSGYEYPESLARALVKAYGLSPKKLQKDREKLLALVHEIYQKGTPVMNNSTNENKYQVTVSELPEVKVACYRHKGSAQGLMQSVQHFISWRQANHTPPSVSRTFNFLYQDPRDCEPADFQFDIGASTNVEVNNADFNIFTQDIPAGLYASIELEGSEQSMSEAIDFIYSKWLPESNYQPLDFPCIVERLRFYPEVAMHQQQFNILVPLK